MTGHPQHFRDRISALLPNREALFSHPWLRPVANRLLDPKLWRFQREAVARGVAVGTFWAFVIPVAQIPAAAVHCTWWRANLPVATAMTMVTNPLTIGFWLWLAYQLGANILGTANLPATVADEGAATWLAEYGWPTLLGMGLFATGGAGLGYMAVKLAWRVRIFYKRRTRRFGG
jgi:uncharacterized protein (DUF2062 family)